MQHLSYSIEGDSETARLVRQTDWNATPLGPLEQWPQSLRTSLNICLACRFPFLVWWGPQMVMLYNDEYMPMLGNRHPAALGGIGREVLADIWDVVGPMLDSVATTGKAVKAEDLLLLMNRAGYVEETYFSFSFSPIVDESGGVNGIFTPCIETTEKVIGRRRVELLRRLGSQPRADNLHDACSAAAGRLADAAEDLPFGIIYAIDQSSGAARLTCSFGLDGCRATVPEEIAPDGDAQPWPVMQAVRTGELQVARGLGASEPDLPRGAWDAPVEQALAIPITMPDQEAATVVLLAAVSPHRALDSEYLSFYRLLADQLRSGISAALSYEAERKRALALAEVDRAKTALFSSISHDGGQTGIGSRAQHGTTVALSPPLGHDALLFGSGIHTMETGQSERMYSILAQAPAAIALLRGPQHTFELANPLYQELMGRHDLLHKPARAALPELDGQGFFDLLDHAYATGKPYVGRALRADLLLGNTGSSKEAYFDCVYQPTFDRGGAVDGIAVFAFDVSETMRARRAAENASRAKDEFIAMLGHELRNPLAPIMTALEVMKLRGIDGVRNEHGIIERQARHMIGLVNDLLDVARVSRGKVELRRETSELATVVAAAVETASPVLEERRQVLALDVPAQGLKLCVDVQRMSQVYANLLTNAAKYSDKGSRITVEGRRDGSDIVLVVTDTGRGIATDMLPRVFDMFYQDPQTLSRSRGGLGLGLTIVRSLTELHGGSVSVDSRGPGMGTTFTVRVPAADTAGLPPAADAGGAGVTQQAAQQVGVLVVDDNVDAAEMLKELLVSFGYGVETAFDAPSALRKLDKFWPDIAILDIGLPGMDGYELAARTRILAGDRPVYLVALTGYGQEGDRERAWAAGFDCHLTKPVNLPTLLDILAEVSSDKLATRERPQAL